MASVGYQISNKIGFCQQQEFIVHQANKMKTRAFIDFRKFLFLHVFLVPAFFAQPAYSQIDDSTAVVYRLYKEFAWEALFASTDDAGKILGRPLLTQSREVLGKYFDDELVRLFLKESACVAKNPGELCKLEFNPIFASQDPAASELSITSANPRRVDVQFEYPSDHSKIRLSYVMGLTPKGWRIVDIKYSDSDASLKDLLRR